MGHGNETEVPYVSHVLSEHACTYACWMLLHRQSTYGHLTWEWREAIRGYTHPLVFAVLYKALAIVNLDWPQLLVSCRGYTNLMSSHKFVVLLTAVHVCRSYCHECCKRYLRLLVTTIS